MSCASGAEVKPVAFSCRRVKRQKVDKYKFVSHSSAAVLNLCYISYLFSNKITRFTPNTLNGVHLFKIQN